MYSLHCTRPCQTQNQYFACGQTALTRSGVGDTKLLEQLENKSFSVENYEKKKKDPQQNSIANFEFLM